MTIFRRFAPASFLALLFMEMPAGAEAQALHATLPAKRTSARVVAVSRRWLDDPATASEIGARILTSGAPSTYQIITVPIPPGVPRRGGGFVEIVPRRGFTVLGARNWPLATLEGKTKVIGIIGISASARAGIVTAADVNFYVPSSPMVTIAVEIDVSLIRELAVRMHSAPLAARAGSQVTFSYELVNVGNATEMVETVVAPPDGWTATQRGGASASVEPNESVARQVVVSIPRTAGTGSFFLRFDIVDKNGAKRSSIPVAVEVLDALSRQGSAGPEITIAVARASDASGRGNTITTASLRGPLFDSVRVDARFSVGDAVAGPYGQALSRLSSYRIRPSLMLSSPHGHLALGAAGNSFSDLTGLYANGTGAALDAHGSGWKLIGLSALSNRTLGSGPPQPMFGLRGDVDVGRMRIMSSLSHLRDGEASRRQLDAAGLGASLDVGFATTIQAEIARRRFASGRGTGWSTEITRSDSRNSARVRVNHAPGGSDAFARAVNEIVADISQSISRRLGVSASVWRLSDATATFAGLRSRGWAIRPEYRVHSSTTVALEAHSTDVNAVTAGDAPGFAGGYGGAERQVGVSVNSNVRELFVSGSVAGGSVSRTLGTGSAGFVEQRSPKIWWNTMASWRGSKTVIEVQGRMEEMRDVSGAVRRPSQVSLRGSRSFSFSPGRGASVDAEVQQIRGFSSRPVTVLRGGVRVPVTEMVAVRLYAERNEFFNTRNGRSPWIYALRIEHSTRVPMLRAPGSSGFVYRDLNGNQRRDEGEPGVDGVVLKRNGETAVTDASGRYRLTGDGRAPIVLDEASLPLGWVRQTTGSPDIAVGSSLRAEIRFVVAPRSSIEPVQVDLSGIHAVARDAAGREWVASMTGPNVASFEALPPGIYTLELDLSGVEEPLVPRVPLPALRVTPFEPSFVTVIFDPRPLRMWRAEPAHSQPRGAR